MSLENTVKESQERSKKKKKQKLSERHEESDQVVKNKKVKKRKEKFSSENDENNAVSMSHSKTKKHRTKRHSETETVEERKEDVVVTGDVRHSKARKRKARSESQDGVKHVKQHQDDSGGKREKKRRERKDKFKDKVPEFLKLVKSKNLKEEEQPEPVAKTPEEIALEKMKEEKRERMKKKRQQKKANKGKKIESTVAKDAALAYLSQWHYHRAVWRFQKVRQVWLLGHMYDTNMVSDENFERLLKYLEDLKGNSKTETTRQAETILAEAEKESEKDEEVEDEDGEVKAEEEGEEEEHEDKEEDAPEDESEDEDSNSDDKKTKKKKKSKDTTKGTHAREELRKSRRTTIAASLSDLPVPLTLSTTEVDSLPITQAPLPNPALPSLCGSSMNFEQHVPEIDLGDPTEPFAVQRIKPVKHIKPDAYVLIDMSHLEKITPPQSFVTACCSSSVFSFIKRLFTLY